MAAINSKSLFKLIPLLGCVFVSLSLSHVKVPCANPIDQCFNALSSTIIYDQEFRAFAKSYFDQWSSTSNYSTTIDDFLESLNEEPDWTDPNYIHIVIDTIFKSVDKPSLGFPYQYAGVDMVKVAESGTEKHSITQQPIRSTDDILKHVPCQIEKLNHINNRIIFGSHIKTEYVNILVSEYFQNNTYGCVEFSMIPSRMSQVMKRKKNFDSYYFQITCFIHLKSKKMEFYNFGTSEGFSGPYSVSDTLAIFDNSE